MSPRATVLRLGSRGIAVRLWQEFLRGCGGALASVVVDGDFGPVTDSATRIYQARAGLRADGVVGPETRATAKDTGALGKPSGVRDVGKVVRRMTVRERRATFGDFSYETRATARNPEGIHITDPAWRSVITRVDIPGMGRSTRIHEAAEYRFLTCWGEWDRRGLLHHVRTFNGCYVPRFQRGSRSKLSNHSWGTAFDINARWNRLGRTPAARGDAGSVRELVAIANSHGWYWGGDFSRADGMHFEVGVML